MKRFLALLLALLMALALAGCGEKKAAAPSGTEGQGSLTPEPPEETQGGKDDNDTDEEKGSQTPEEPQVTSELTVAVRRESAAIAAAGLSDEYAVSCVEDASGALLDGSAQAAIMGVDEAARAYAASGGQVQIAALILSGGWKIAGEAGVGNMFDLAGATVYLPNSRQAEDRLFEYIAGEYGFIIGDTLNISYVADVDVGGEGFFLIPSYAAGDFGETLDLAGEWENITGEKALPTACLAVRADVEDGTLAGLLAELEVSAGSGAENAGRAVELGIASDGAQAQAMAQAGEPMWVTGPDDIRETLQEYLRTLYILGPEIIGGHIPDDGFYR